MWQHQNYSKSPSVIQEVKYHVISSMQGLQQLHQEVEIRMVVVRAGGRRKWGEPHTHTHHTMVTM